MHLIPVPTARALRWFLLLTLAVAFPGQSDAQAPSARGALVPGTYALTHANVISMTSADVQRDVTVLIRDGRIADIGPSVRIPAGARTIDVTGKYVMPGLADMHTHLYADGTLPDSVAPYELGVMIANGVTAARFMAGTPAQLQLREQVARGSVLGPQLWVASPMFANKPDHNVRVVTSPDSARAAVRDVAAAGYDFVKVTFGITGETYDALVAEARARRIPVVGHVEPALGLAKPIAAGQELEHLDAFLEAALADSAPMKESLTQYGAYAPRNWASLDYIDDRKLNDLARVIVYNRTWIGPTLEAFNRWFSVPYSDAELMALPDWKLIPEPMRTQYMGARAKYWAQPVSREQRAKLADVRKSMVKKIADAGGAARMLAASDAPDLLFVYGFALHREIHALADAGLTPYQALASATRNPAEFLGASREWGTVEEGKRADLVVLDANPLEDIRNTARIHTVVVGGRVLDRADLDRLIASASAVIRPNG